MKKKLLFIFNPCSGKGQIKNKLMEVIDIMVKAGYEVTVHSTQDREDAMQKVKNVRRKIMTWSFAAAVTALWMRQSQE